VLGDVFKQGGFESMGIFTLPYPHPMLGLLREGACIVEDRYFDISGWRVRIINLASTLQKLVPLFEQRLAQSQFADWQGSLLLDGGWQKAVLNIEQCKVEIIKDASAANVLCGGADIARFLIGSDEPEEIIRQANMECRGLAVPLARALFPNLHPMMSHLDEY
jgi:hypothetical protein